MLCSRADEPAALFYGEAPPRPPRFPSCVLVGAPLLASAFTRHGVLLCFGHTNTQTHTHTVTNTPGPARRRYIASFCSVGAYAARTSARSASTD